MYPELAWLQEQGVNLWYDEGISGGKVWRAEIGDAIDAATQVLFYVSESSLASDHCNREINLALDESRAIVPVFLEHVDLSSDLRVGLSRVQALHRYKDATYKRHLLGALDQVAQSASASSPEEAVTTVQPADRRSALGTQRTLAIRPFTCLGRDDPSLTDCAEVAEEDLREQIGATTLVQTTFSPKGQIARSGLLSRDSDTTVGSDFDLNGRLRRVANQVKVALELIRTRDAHVAADFRRN